MEPRALLAAAISASSVDTFTLDADSDGLADPGDQLHYTVTVQNTGDASATNLTFQEIINNPNLTLVANSINVSPLAINDTFSAVANTQLRVGTPGALGGPAAVVAGNVLSNDMEFVGDTLGANVVISAFDATSTQGGTVSMVTSGANRGSFYYVPQAGDTGTDTFTYTLRDDGIDNIANNSDDLTSVGTVTITIGTNKVWYVDNTAGATGDGTSSNPFDSLADVSGATGPDAAGDIIFVHTGGGNYTGGMTLLNNQTLWGQGQALIVDGFTLQSAGTRPSLTHNAGSTVSLVSGNLVRGVSVTNTNGSGISGSNVGTLSLSNFDSTATNGSALSVTTSGTVTATGTGNVLTATTGAALNVDNVNIGASGLNFQSISANGGANGIVLNTTGASGGLTVTGDAGSTNNGSGGTIQNSTGAGISLTFTQNVSLDQLNITNPANSGINGTRVTNFAYTNGTITGAGSAGVSGDLYSAIAFNGSTFGVANIAGTLTVTGSTFTNAFYSGLDVQSGNGTVTNATITGNTITNPGFSGINFVGTGTATTEIFNLNKATISNNSITGSGGNGIQLSVGNATATGVGATLGIPGDATNIISLSANTISLDSTGTNAIIVANSNNNGASRGRTNFEIKDHTSLGSSAIGTSILIGNNGHSTMTGLIHNNTITATHTANLGGGNGIGGGNGAGSAGATATPDLTLTATSNTISGTDGNGILLVGRGSTGTARLKVANNNVSAPVNAGGTSRQGIRVDAGNNAAGSDDAVYLNIFGNTSAGSNGAAGIGVRKQGSVSTTHDFGIFDAAGGPDLPSVPANADVQTFINALNAGSVGGTDIVSGSNYQEDLAQAPALLFAPSASNVATSSSSNSTSSESVPEASVSNAAPGNSQPVIVDDGVLSQAELDSLVDAAIGRWESTGLTAEQTALLHNVTFLIEELPGWHLGRAEAGVVTLDANAAGNSWFIDATPADDSEFSGSGTSLQATTNGGAKGRVDALTTVMHELGHQLGLEDSYVATNSTNLMYGWIGQGERRLPATGQAVGADPAHLAEQPGPDFLFGAQTIGTLPAGQGVTIVYDATVNSLTNGLAPATVSSQLRFLADGGINVLSDDPAAGGAADPTTTNVDSLTLGGQIWIEANNNTVFNSGTDTGASPIALTLFLSDGTTVVTTGSANGSGVYQFTGLLPGDYIVRVDASNFGAGQTLDGKVSITGSVDPDDNVDNDDNGVDDAAPATNGIRSLPITLAYNTETTADGTGQLDINNTLDLGFKTAPIPPVVDLNGAGAGQDVTTAFTEQTPVLISPLGTLADTDSTNLDSLTVTLTTRPDGDAIESLSLNLVATAAAGGLTVSYTNGTGVLSISGSAAVATYQTILQGILYGNTSDTPTTTNRSISVVANDGSTSSATQTVTLTVAAVNDAPVIAAFDANVTYVENAAPLMLDADATVTDPDSANFNTGTLTVTLTAGAQATDLLEIQNQGVGAGEIGVSGVFVTFGGVPIGTFAGGGGNTPLVVTLNASATPTAVQALLQNITFRSTSDNPVTAARTVQVSLIDDLGAVSNQPTKLIDITAVNDAPVLSGIEVTNVGYTENNAGVNISPGILVNDADHANLTGATVTISGNYANGQDELLFTNANGISGVWSPATGVLTLTGSASFANYRTALRSVKYRNTSDNPSNLVRTIQYVVNDGALGSNVVSRNLNVNPLNDQPILSGLAANPLVYFEGALPTSVQPSVTITDLDHTNMTSARIRIRDNYQIGADLLSFTPLGNITGVFTPATGTLVLSGVDSVANYQAALRSVKFQNTSENPSSFSRQVLMLVNDGVINSPVAFRSVNVTPVNDAPVLANIEAAPLAYTEGDPATNLTSTLTVSDIDSATLTFARIKISTNYVNGQDVLSFVDTVNITASWDAGSGTLVLTGTDTVANYQAALRNVKYHNTSTTPSTLPRTVLMLVNDGNVNSSVVSRNINVTSVP